MEIKIIKKNKKDFLDLLLLADEQENMIEKYLFRGEMFALYENDLKSICVVTEENDHACEIKNLATYKNIKDKVMQASFSIIYLITIKISLRRCL